MKIHFLIAAFVVGGVVGYAVDEVLTVDPTVEAQPVARPAKGAIADVGVLREKRVSYSEVVVTNVVTTTNAVGGGNGPRGNPREWMERLKREDPARFAQMTNRFEQWRARRQESRLRKADFLASIDTSHMSAAAKKTHDDLQTMLARQEELEEQLHQEDLSDDERHALMRQMREMHREMRRLNAEERSNLLGETVRLLGFEGEDAKEITATIHDVLSATEEGFGRHGGPPSGGRP